MSNQTVHLNLLHLFQLQETKTIPFPATINIIANKLTFTNTFTKKRSRVTGKEKANIRKERRMFAAEGQFLKLEEETAMARCDRPNVLFRRKGVL